MSPSNVNWIKSSYSQHGGECVEVVHLDGGLVGVRDSKNPSGPALMFNPDEWDAFTAGVTSGKFNGHNA
ncbi:DUF397 domain-containing protein [Nocardia vaccinii]|uniref:DUF397 domain-containing protein n=1 Tax=Nocardia vaccinii TaxID=1822 RepID=UPI0008364254|nr:DUF397 domain-containing protein [Nocardia vaccinii]